MRSVESKAIGWAESGLIPDGIVNADRWWSRWRMFFVACEELFRFNDGRWWFVNHYRFTKAGG